MKFVRSERGSTLVIVALFIVVLFGFAALSLDVSNVYREKNKAQAATDAAALAGVARLDPSDPAGLSNAIAEADVIANTNGVTDGEIVASAAGQIQVGFWDGTAFTAGATPYNAVSVPALRTVTNNFARVVGFPIMTPTVDSIATAGVPAMQYGVPTNAVDGVAIGSNITLQVWNSGNWGCVDLCGVSLNGSKTREDGLSNGGCFVAVGTEVPTETGNDGIANGFQDVGCNTIVVMPVTSAWPNGNGNVVVLVYCPRSLSHYNPCDLICSRHDLDVRDLLDTTLDFIVVRLTDPNCAKGGSNSGANWTYQVTLLGRGFSALQQYGMGPVRALVQ